MSDNSEDTERTKRLVAAWRGAQRKLSRSLLEPTVGELLGSLAEAPYDMDGPADVYGDGVVTALEGKVAELLGTEDAAFFPSGTMAQQIALRCWAGRTGNPVVALHPMSHPERWEGRSPVGRLRTARDAPDDGGPPADGGGGRGAAGALRDPDG